MNELPQSILKAVSRYKPVEMDGLTLYPVLVSEYDLFLEARPALEVLHQSLPVRLMRMPLLSALYQMDYEAILHGETPSGLFSRAMLALALSLRLGEGQEAAERKKSIQFSVDREDPRKLLRLRFTDGNGTEHEISPVQFKILREIIAAQNGVELESDKANPDLVRAKRDMNSSGAPTLDARIEDLITAVSALSNVEEEEIDQWPILKLQRRADSFQRMMGYIVCGVGEVNGTTWKGGNPNPHPFFRRTEQNTLLSELGARADGNKPAPPEAAREIAEITNQL